VIPFPRDAIHDEDAALRWWDDTFAHACEGLGVQISAACLARAIVASLRDIRRESEERPLSLAEAAHESGYSRDHLGREIRAGRIPNAGKRNAPRIERRHLPRKLGSLPLEKSEDMFSRRQIALSVVTSNEERHDG
jgi:hypothetical protein